MLTSTEGKKLQYENYVISVGTLPSKRSQTSEGEKNCFKKIKMK